MLRMFQSGGCRLLLCIVYSKPVVLRICKEKQYICERLKLEAHEEVNLRQGMQLNFLGSSDLQGPHQQNLRPNDSRV
jgi:hypothetical protein